jgi:uncharacterized membrane protein YeaQ/YmgE (transglycosylase-associated protein family)
MDVITLFNSIMALSALVIVGSEWLSKYTKADGKWARLQSWAVAIILGIISTWLNIGIFNDMSWKGGAVIGIVSALVANGIFTMDMIKKVLETLKIRTFVQ